MGTGNPGHWSPSYRCGADTHEECNTGEWDNKWSMTTFARKVDTGEVDLGLPEDAVRPVGL